MWGDLKGGGAYPQYLFLKSNTIFLLKPKRRLSGLILNVDEYQTTKSKDLKRARNQPDGNRQYNQCKIQKNLLKAGILRLPPVR